MAAVEKTKELPPRKLIMRDFKETEFARARLTARLPTGWTFEEAMRPDFWSQVCHLLQARTVTGEPDRAGAHIELTTEDHAFYAELYVRAVQENGLLVSCIGPQIDPDTGKSCPVDLATGRPWKGATDVSTDAYDVRWNVGRRGYDIVRKSDGSIVADGSKIKTKEQAAAWIRSG